MCSVQVTIAMRSCSRLPQARLLRMFFYGSAKNDSMAVLSSAAPTRPMDPSRLHPIVDQITRHL